MEFSRKIMKCNCRWKNCKRHGKCDECREHHKNHPKHPLPYCEKNKKQTTILENEITRSNEMDGIKLMIEEHKIIARMLKVIRSACYDVMNGKEIDYNDFENMIDFVRNYADKYHHEKEERFLFNKMVDEIGGAAEKLVKFGMLVEHDMGRLYMMELEKAVNNVKAGDDEARLDVIANAISYTHLLLRHIDKEDNVAYPYAKRELSKETINKVNNECNAFEEKMKISCVKDKYFHILEMLEQKYLNR